MILLPQQHLINTTTSKVQMSDSERHVLKRPHALSVWSNYYL
jgi:hypothetical protein